MDSKLYLCLGGPLDGLQASLDTEVVEKEYYRFNNSVASGKWIYQRDEDMPVFRYTDTCVLIHESLIVKEIKAVNRKALKEHLKG